MQCVCMKKEQAQQHNTPEVVTFLKKNELPRAGLEPMTLYALSDLPAESATEATNHSAPDEQAITINSV